jgi:predicted phage terminase large subunit-like protein
LFNTVEDYRRFAENLRSEPELVQRESARYLAQTDLFFLMWFVLGRTDIARPWLLERCKEVQDSADGFLDLWARDHYKSTIITVGKTLQDIICNIITGRQITVGIFSHTRPIAKAFLRQIKRECEQNKLLPYLFPEVFWENVSDAPKWSEDDGLILKRTDNPKEATLEAWGLVDGQPTGKHFTHRIYDDVVTRESVNTPEMIAKTTDAWAMSTNLGTQDGIARYIGTRYHFNDTYREIIARGAALPRIHAATKDGTPDGEPVLLTREQLAEKRRTQGPYIFASQMLQNPRADETQGFRKEWLRFHKGTEGDGMNKYILVDAASEKKKTSDYTAMAVIGIGSDENYYLLDLIRDRLSLTQRADALFRLVRKWKPMSVGYEKYGQMADIEHIQQRMQKESYHFNVVPLGGQTAKNDRIKRLIPLFEQGRFFLPQSRFYTMYDGRTIDLIETLIAEEYDAFPVPVHDDMLDAISRVIDEDLSAVFPRVEEERERYTKPYKRGSPWSA